MKQFGTLVILLSVVLQGWALSLSWPADGYIFSNTTIQVSFSGGVAPYTLVVLGLVPGGADGQLQVFTNQTGDSVQWRVSVPDGFVRFNVTDANGGTLASYWQSVYPNPATSGSSVPSTVLVYSTNVLWATVTVTAGSESGTSSADSGTNSKSSITIGAIVGGVLGGVATLLVMALFVFWIMRRRCPVPEDDDATQYSAVWNDAHDRVSIAPDSQYSPTLNPYQLVPFESSASPPVYTEHEPQSQLQPMTEMYSDLPESRRNHPKSPGMLGLR
ncbi:hypothetical protein BDV93DRAFT_523339 [Ceratobasidium sp. AG-I]|nr:hypothetical protein BDV93DRAFT_523339 [Ceratobasidium sp. AG-I]